jgi:hypothetical protein
MSWAEAIKYDGAGLLAKCVLGTGRGRWIKRGSGSAERVLDVPAPSPTTTARMVRWISGIAINLLLARRVRDDCTKATAARTELWVAIHFGDEAR